MPRVLNKRTDDIPPDAVYVGRPTKWGNPFTMKNEEDRNRVCGEYQWWFWSTDLKHDLHELKGKDLVCWCAPERCHADFLLEAANK